MSQEGEDVVVPFHNLVITINAEHEAQYEEQPGGTEDPQPDAGEPASDAGEDEPASDAGEDPYYVHIDVRDVTGQDEEERAFKRSAIARHINKYMLGLFHYDPRRYHNFFDDVWAGEPQLPSRADMRRAMRNMANSYYELWAVKGDFDLPAFYNSFAQDLDFDGFTIKMCAMHGANGHTNTLRHY